VTGESTRRIGIDRAPERLRQAFIQRVAEPVAAHR
jgi:hypothetical protein